MTQSSTNGAVRSTSAAAAAGGRAGALSRAQAGRVVIEDYRPLAASIEWRLGQRYFRERGAKAFSDPVPSVINNDGTLSAAAASNAVTITASAGGTFTATQTFTWTVSSLTNPGTLTNSDGDTGVSVALTASPPSGSAVTFSATGLPSGLSIAGSGHLGTITGTIGATADLGSPYTVTVTGTQGSYSTSQVFTWIVEPRLVLANPGPQTNAPGSVSLVIPVYYSGSGTVSYSASSLPSGLSITSTSNTSLTISGTISSGAISATPHYVALTATQGSYTSTQNFDWTVPAFVVNPISDQSSTDGQSVSLTVTASASATFSASGLPYGLTINSSTGVISGTIVNFDDTEDDDTVTVTATSGSNTASQTFDWTDNPNVNVVRPGDQANNAGDTVAGVYISGTDVNTSATLTYLAAGLPSGLSLNTSTGLISGTIASGAWSASPYTVTIEATDGTYFDSQTFSWTVNRLGIVDPGPQIFGEGASVSLAMTANTTVTWSASGLPSGLSINSTTGLISGTVGGSASSDSPYAVTVTASVSGVPSVTDTFQLNVPLDGLATPADQTSTDGASVTLGLTSTQSSSQTFVAAGLPPGLSINSSTGAITGTIAAGSAGSYTVDVSVTYSDTTTMTSFAWTVNPAITFAGTADQTNTVSNYVSFGVSASDTYSGTLTYSIAGQPAGVSINSSSGTISGTISSGAQGAYAVTVSATDGTYTGSETFNWRIHASSDSGPTLTNPGTQFDRPEDDVDSFPTGTDPDGSPLTFSVEGLPPGLDLADPTTGEINGTLDSDPYSSAPYSVTITVEDDTSHSTSQTFKWLVQDAPLSASAVNISTTEGVDPGLLTVATFSTGNANDTADDFTALVNWGDGQSDTAEVNASTGGGFEVDDDHTYAAAGSYTFEVEITSADGAKKRVSGTATVSAAAMTLGAVNQTAANGVTTTFELGTFADANPNLGAGSFTVDVTDWGDSSGSSSGTVTESAPGLFDVWGEHTYTITPTTTASYTVHWKVTATASGNYESETSSVEVGDALEGIPANFNWGTVTTASGSSTSPDAYTAVQAWLDSDANNSPSDPSLDDGTMTYLSTNGSGGNLFLVTGEHTYEAPHSTYSLPSVTVLENSYDPYYVPPVIYKDWKVLPAPIQASGENVVVDAGVSINVEVAKFTDPDLEVDSSAFSATVTVNGTSQSGTIVCNGNGRYGIYAIMDGVNAPISISLAQSGSTIAAIESVEQAKQALTLSVSKTMDPIRGAEGAYIVPYQWSVKGNTTGGWIIQRILMTYQVKNEANRDITTDFGVSTETKNFYEAWQVPAKQSAPVAPPDEIYQKTLTSFRTTLEGMKASLGQAKLKETQQYKDITNAFLPGSPTLTTLAKANDVFQQGSSFFAAVPGKALAPTSGTITISASAWFVETNVDLSQNGFMRNNPNTTAGWLLSRTDGVRAAAFIAGLAATNPESPLIDHNLTAEWTPNGMGQLTKVT